MSLWTKINGQSRHSYVIMCYYGHTGRLRDRYLALVVGPLVALISMTRVLFIIEKCYVVRLWCHGPFAFCVSVHRDDCVINKDAGSAIQLTTRKLSSVLSSIFLGK